MVASLAPEPADATSSAAPATDTTPAPAPAPLAATQPAPASTEAERFTVQLGSFEYQDTARRVADYFAEKGVVVVISHANSPDGRNWIVVRSGEFDSAADADSALAMIRSMGLVEPILVRHHVAPAA
jgi:cell division septation protein DedD